MCVIFSRRILFSLSISVYRSKNGSILNGHTFKHLVFLEFLLDMPELYWLAGVNTCFDVLELSLVDVSFFLVPFPLQEFAADWNDPVHYIQFERMVPYFFAVGDIYIYILLS